jgi:protein involved in polysaccharide export with SLBB domain
LIFCNSKRDATGGGVPSLRYFSRIALLSLSVGLLLAQLPAAQAQTAAMGAAIGAAMGGAEGGSSGSAGSTGSQVLDAKGLQTGAQQVDSAGQVLGGPKDGSTPASAIDAARAAAAKGNGKQSKSEVGTAPLSAAKTSTAAVGHPLQNTEFQNFVSQSTGKTLPLFGYNLFEAGAFGSVQAYTVPSGYVMGPGDELVLQVYGLMDIADRFVVDRDGRITLPKVGPLTLAGVPFADAEKTITAHLSKVYKNFQVSVSMGRLRSIEVFVVGQARHPGKQVVSSLSTLINALFETGGPSANGSMRAIELRRGGKTIASVDLYQFLAKGDSSGDVHLLSGDVIYIPPAGARSAVLGTIHTPAIYELKGKESIKDVLSLSGGLPVLASPHRAQLDRVNAQEKVARFVEDFALDTRGLSVPLADGDVLTVFPISPQIANAVTLQGNGITPLRTTFKPGMKVSDVLSDLSALIPGSYWFQLNQGAHSGSYSRPEINLHYATIQRLDSSKMRTRVLAFNLTKAIAKDPQENLTLQSGDVLTVYKPGEAGADTQDSVFIAGEIVGGAQRFVWRPGFTVKDIIPSAQWLIDYYDFWQRPVGNNLRDEINWDYAQIIRRVPSTLTTEAITFNLGAAVLREDPASNLVLQPGDKIALFNTSQVAVPVAKRIRMVTLSGEVAVPGVYQALPGETLPQIIRRAGGFTADSYVYGLDFKRESVRRTQQENLDRLIKQFEKQIEADSSKRLQNVVSTDAATQAQMVQAGVQADQLKLSNLRKLRASGRVALGLDPKNTSLENLPLLALEDGDNVNVPSVPAFVGAYGSVYNENAMLWKSGVRVSDVIDQAGLTNYSDASELYVLRADGTVQGGSGNGLLAGLFSSNSSLTLMPGDTVVVPEKADRETAYSAFVRGAKDWTAILAQFGLGAAAFRSLGY